MVRRFRLYGLRVASFRGHAREDLLARPLRLIYEGKIRASLPLHELAGAAEGRKGFSCGRHLEKVGGHGHDVKEARLNPEGAIDIEAQFLGGLVGLDEAYTVDLREDVRVLPDKGQRVRTEGLERLRRIGDGEADAAQGGENLSRFSFFIPGANDLRCRGLSYSRYIEEPLRVRIKDLSAVSPNCRTILLREPVLLL